LGTLFCDGLDVLDRAFIGFADLRGFISTPWFHVSPRIEARSTQTLKLISATLLPWQS
jgi:hypothetical protein